MIFSEKLQLLRKSKGLTQDDLAEKLSVSRQAIAKWESGLAYPDISNLIYLSECLFVTVDYLVKDDACQKQADIISKTPQEFVGFLLRAKQKTYAGSGDFLKAALSKVPAEMPYRGPECFHEGAYVYRCSVNGSLDWFQGYEEIYWESKRVYECFFHGGAVQ